MAGTPHHGNFIRDYLLICLALLIIFIAAVVGVYIHLRKTAPPPKPLDKRWKSRRHKKKSKNKRSVVHLVLEDIEKTEKPEPSYM